MVKPMVHALSVTVRRGKYAWISNIDVALLVALITPAPMRVALLVVMRRRATHREYWRVAAGRHLGLRREVHVYSRRVDVGGSGAGRRPLHRIVRRVRVTSNRRGVRSGRGWCRLCHYRRMARRWSGSVVRFLAVILEIRVIAAVFSCIINRLDRRMGPRGLGQGSRMVCGSRRLYHSIGIIHSSSGGWIRLHVSIRWVPMIVVHRVRVMWIAPRSSRIVSMVGVGNKGRLLPRG